MPVTVEITTRRSARKAKGDGHLRRAEILEAAERIFVAEGYEGATIRRIAEEVGVSSTCLYMHFPDKAAMLKDICDRALTELMERNKALAAKPLDAAVRVRMMLESYMRWGLQHPNAYQLVYCAPRTSSPAWSEGTLDLSTQCYDVFRDLVREVAAAGRLRTGTADSAAQALWMSGHGAVALLIGRPNFAWADQEELVGVVLEGVMTGLILD